MDILDRLLGHDAWTTRELLVLARSLTDDELDRPMGIGPGPVRATFEHLVYNIEAWFDSLNGRPLRARGGDAETIDAMIARAENIYAEFAEFAKSVRERGALDDVWTETRSEGDVTLTYGGTIVHVITHSMHHRAQLLYMLRRLGVEGVPEGDALSWEHRGTPK